VEPETRFNDTERGGWGAGDRYPANGDTHNPAWIRNLAMDRRPAWRLLWRLMTGLSDSLDVANIRPTAPAQHVDVREPLTELGMLATKLGRVSIV
jgi:hypothetical protein